MESIQVVEQIARKIQERENPDVAIRNAVAQIVEGLMVLKRLGFSADEVKEVSAAVWRARL